MIQFLLKKHVVCYVVYSLYIYKITSETRISASFYKYISITIATERGLSSITGETARLQYLHSSSQRYHTQGTIHPKAIRPISYDIIYIIYTQEEMQAAKFFLFF